MLLTFGDKISNLLSIRAISSVGQSACLTCMRSPVQIRYRPVLIIRRLNRISYETVDISNDKIYNELGNAYVVSKY